MGIIAFIRLYHFGFHMTLKKTQTQFKFKSRWDRLLQSEKSFNHKDFEILLKDISVNAKLKDISFETSLAGPIQNKALPSNAALLQVIESKVLTRSQKKECAEKLLKVGADVKAILARPPHSNALHLACHQGDTELVSFLLLQGFDTLMGDGDHMTPLHYAIGKKDTALVSLLLEHPFHIDARNRWGRGVLHLAASYPILDLMTLFLSHRAHIDLQDDNGDTPLHFAVLSEHKAAVDLLLSHGARTDIFNQAGHSPLFFAIKNNDTSMAMHLLRAGASLDTKNNKGLTTREILPPRSGMMMAALERGEIEAATQHYSSSYPSTDKHSTLRL